MGRVSLVIMMLIALAASSPMAVPKYTNSLVNYLREYCDNGKPPGTSWANNWDEMMHFNCPHGQSISAVKSVFRACKRDRIWSFSCQNTALASSCSWTNFVNDWDGPLFYLCPHDGVISGLESIHDNHKEDRRFKIKCCRDDDYFTYDCSTSSYINKWNDIMNYAVPPGHFMVGLFSYHRNDREDRVWKVQICRARKEV